MPDQSAEATLRYVLDSGVNAIELMNGPVWDYAQKKTGFTPPNAGRGRGAGATGRGPGGAPAAAASAAEAASGSWRGSRAQPDGDRAAAVDAERRLPNSRQHKRQRPTRRGDGSRAFRWTSSRISKDVQRRGRHHVCREDSRCEGADEDLDTRSVGKTLGATHMTAELPAHSDTSTAPSSRRETWR